MRLQLVPKPSDSNESSQTVIAPVITSTTVNILSTLLPCPYCQREAAEMAGAFAAYKIRDHINASQDSNGSSSSSWAGSDSKSQSGSSWFQSTTVKSLDRGSNPPAKYNEKMMMSIWGLYNKYSVHNIKSHNTFGQ